ncbi:MAG: ADP-ribosylglycohydrolase family protein [Lachnospiraceae bacterium]|nr:ADP-ribosylglycohydrolase family protein [Lachnospiraceae bacterium]
MLGAIIGDIVGSTRESAPVRSTEFHLFEENSRFTDDTVMTIAVADALLSVPGDWLDTPEEHADGIRGKIVQSMQTWGRRYPDAGYGGWFMSWLCEEDPKPYNSYGNGSAMRVSPAGWLAESEEAALALARLSAEVTHNHPEGIRGAQAVALAVFLARNGAPKKEIKKTLSERFGYDLSADPDDLRATCRFDSSCQVSVPQALACFFAAESYEEAVRLAVSLGGDADTQADIAGAVAEGYFGIPEYLKREGRRRLSRPMVKVLERFRRHAPRRYHGRKGTTPLTDNDRIEMLLPEVAQGQAGGQDVVLVLRSRMFEDGQFLVPCEENEKGEMVPRLLQDGSGDAMLPVFTSEDELGDGNGGSVMKAYMDNLYYACLRDESVKGMVINPWNKNGLSIEKKGIAAVVGEKS